MTSDKLFDRESDGGALVSQLLGKDVDGRVLVGKLGIDAFGGW